MSNLLSTGQVADRLNVSRSTVLRLVHTQSLPAVSVGRLLRFDPAGVDEWLRLRSTGSEAR